MVQVSFAVGWRPFSWCWSDKVEAREGDDGAAERAAPRTGEDGPSESDLAACPTVQGVGVFAARH